MANKIKKISINAFEKAVNAQYEPIQTIEWNGIEILVNHTLTLHDMLAFVDLVVKNCFSNTDGAYMPEIKDFAIRNAIIEYYTNISLPLNVEKKYDLLYHSPILEEILPIIDQSQFKSIIRSIDEKTAHLAQANIEAVTKQMNELYATFDNMQKQINESFGNIDNGALSKVVETLIGGTLDEEKIVNAVLKAKSEQEDTPEE